MPIAHSIALLYYIERNGYLNLSFFFYYKFVPFEENIEVIVQ